VQAEDDADQDYDPGLESDDQEWADFVATLPTDTVDEFLDAETDVPDSSGLRFLSASKGRAWVTIAPGANRAGHPLHSQVIAFVRALSIAYGQPLTIGTGTNHSQWVKGSRPRRQSQHWTGDAADIAAFDPALRRLGQMALIVAGAKPSWARQQTGGFWTIRGANIGFDTSIGGNHFNHLHVGLLRLPLGLGAGGVTIPGTVQPGSAPAPPAPVTLPGNVPLRNALDRDWRRFHDGINDERARHAVYLRQAGRGIKRAVR
jgi:hypothetical protein